MPRVVARRAGIVSIALGLSFVGAALVEAAGPVFPIRLSIFTPPATKPSPGPQAGPSQQAHRRSFLGDGPLTIHGEGNLQAGVFYSSRNGIGTDSNRYSGAMMITAERRTANATVSISQPLGYQSGASALGQMTARYSTGSYGFSYGLIAGPSASQLQLGGFARGVGLTIPRRRGELALYGATTSRVGAMFRVLGARRLFETRRGTFSFTAFDEHGIGAPGGNIVGDLSYLAYGRRISTQAEIAVSRAHGLSDAPDGARVAGALHLDLAGGSGFTSINLQAAPNGFSTLQQYSTPSILAQVTARRDLGKVGSLTLDFGHNDTRDLYGTSDHATLGSVAFTRPLWAGSVGLVESVVVDGGTAGSNFLRQSALTISQAFKKLTFTAALQTSSTTGSRGYAAQRALSFGAARELLGGTFSYSFTRALAVGDGDEQVQDQHQLLYQRKVGKKLDVGTILSLEHMNTGGLPSVVRSESLTLTRRFSPVVALQIAGGRTQQSGPGGGTATTFSASILGPLSFGETQYGGRVNPKLPATIRGSVTTIYGDTGLGTSRSRASNNVLVVLDGIVTQRTDVNGGFEFRFVKPGVHTVSLEAGTIAPGLLADSDSQTVRVQGGQVANVSFAIGLFAGVSGYVTVDDNGKQAPVPGVGIAIDGIRAATTDANGRYSAARLTPGGHKVSVQTDTLPTSITMRESSKTVQVSLGVSTRANFTGVRLGGITGTVLYAGDGGFGTFLPAPNVYVVAQPGDHAAITDDQGEFILDNLPPGTYTLDVDKDTTPEGQGIVSGPDGPVDVASGAAVSGIVFKLGAAGKSVVYTFDNGKKKDVTVETLPQIVPPGGLLDIIARTSATVPKLSVHSDVFGNFALHKGAGGTFLGSVVVPQLAKGDYALSVSDDAGADGEALVSVDPAVSLVTLRTVPAHPTPGSRVRVRARILAPVAQGDLLRFVGGETVRMPAPKGRVFVFDVRVGRLPAVGEITMRNGVKLPLTIR